MCSRMSVSPTPTCVRCAMHSPDPRTQRDDQPRLIYLHAIYLVAQHPRNTPVFWHSPPAIRAGGIVVQGASSCRGHRLFTARSLRLLSTLQSTVSMLLAGLNQRTASCVALYC